MKIALASIHPRPLSGQIEGLVGMAQALEACGHSVRLVSAFPSRQLLGAGRLQINAAPGGLFLQEPFRMLRIIGDLVRLGSRVDVIHLNLPTPAFSFVADFLQAMVRPPVVVGFEAHLVDTEHLLSSGHLRRALSFYLPRLLVNNMHFARLGSHRAASYVVSSRYQKSELEACGVDAGRIRIVPNLLPRDKLERRSGDSVRATLPPGRIITYVGHYNHVKGVDVLVRAFGELAPRWPDLRLVLAWSGLGPRGPVLADALGTGYRDRIVELGRVRVLDLMSASDVVVLPYRMTIGQAAYPATLLEAFAANVPVVTSDLPLLRELTQGGRTALLAPPDDPHALRLETERVLNEPLLVRQMLQAQREWLRRVQPQRVVMDYEELYERVTAGQAPVLLPVRNREGV
ncbi:MAG: glycosyltransferase family 4 protein [Rudaea sp.]